MDYIVSKDIDTIVFYTGNSCYQNSLNSLLNAHYYTDSRWLCFS